jgi:hypothetical protein
MNKDPKHNDDVKKKDFQIEELENRDAPKIIGVGGDGGEDEPLKKGGGKPQKA